MNRVFAVFVVVLCGAAQAGWVRTFQDEFDGQAVDATKWDTSFRYAGVSQRTLPGNAELEVYVDDGPVVQNGVLKLVSRRQNVSWWGTVYPFASSLIASHNHFSQKFGYFEMRAKMPVGQGTWPAFWLLPLRRVWPPEIDIFELLGSRPYEVKMTYHHLGANQVDQPQGGAFDGPDYGAGFHTFAVLWRTDVVIWYVDGVERFRVSGAEVPQEPMYILANVGVGGWDGTPAADVPFPTSMDVDYIRVYQESALGPYAAIPGPDGVSPQPAYAEVPFTPGKVNVVQNPGFDQGAASWHLGAGSTITNEPGHGAVVSSVGLTSVGQTVSLKPATSYVLSATARLASPGARSMIGVKAYGGREVFKGITSDTPAPVSLKFTTGATNTSALIYFYTTQGHAVADNFVVLEEIPAPRPTIHQFTLVRANTTIPIGVLEEGMTLDPFIYGANATIGVVAEANDTTQSVQFVLDDHPLPVRNSEPYSLFGGVAGHVLGGLTAGRHRLVALPTAIGMGNGTQGAPRVVTFTVPAVGINLIQNAGFEHSVAPWQLAGFAQLVHAGSGWSLATSAGGAASQRVLNLRPSTTYVLSCFAHVGAAGAKSTLSIKGTGEAVGAETTVVTPRTVRVALRFTTGTSTTSAVVSFSTSSGSGWADDFALTPL